MNLLFMKSLFILVCFVCRSTSARRNNNEVYPPTKDPSFKPPKSVESAKSDDDYDELRDFFMNNVEDRQICQVPGLKELIIKKDGSGVGWWSRRCFSFSSRLPDITKVKISKEKKEGKQLGSKSKKKLNNLLKKAKCQPVRQMIDIANLTSPDVSFVPCSVQVKRCSGCCNNDVLQCVPTAIRMRSFTVMKLVKPNGIKRSVRRTRFSLPKESSLLHKIKVPEHKKCECLCKEKASDCTSRQEYNPHICTCVCSESIRRQCPKGTVWSENDCTCLCLKRKECTTGMVFNQESCTCEFVNDLQFFEYSNNK